MTFMESDLNSGIKNPFQMPTNHEESSNPRDSDRNSTTSDIIRINIEGFLCTCIDIGRWKTNTCEYRE